MIDIEQITVTVEPDVSSLVIGSTDEVTISIPPEAAEIVIAGIQGPQGPAGAAGGGIIALLADGAIGGHRVLIGLGNGRCGYADASNIAHAGKVIGISVNAASDGGSVEVLPTGEITEPTWTWAVGPVYLGVNGLLTQTPPSGGFRQMVGMVLGTTRIVVDLKEPVLLS